MKYAEEAAQMQVVRWLKQYHPGVLVTSAAAAGERLNIRKAMRVKAMGYRPGTPDLMVFEPRSGYHGLFIEMKREKGSKLSPIQKDMICALMMRGYLAVVCHGAQEAVDTISDYLKGNMAKGGE